MTVNKRKEGTIVYVLSQLYVCYHSGMCIITAVCVLSQPHEGTTSNVFKVAEKRCREKKRPREIKFALEFGN